MKNDTTLCAHRSIDHPVDSKSRNSTAMPIKFKSTICVSDKTVIAEQKKDGRSTKPCLIS